MDRRRVSCTPVSLAMSGVHSLGTQQVLNKGLWNWIDTFRTGSVNLRNAEHIIGKGTREEP